jgi:transcription elongation factor GreA
MTESSTPTAAETYWISRAGYFKLQQHRDKLQSEIASVQQEMGMSASMDPDLRENPHYMQLRTRLMYVLPRELIEVERVLRGCTIIEDSELFKKSNFDTVQLGAEVLIDFGSGDKEAFLILGYGEADTKRGIISYLSPLGRALLGRKAGDEIQIDAPGGKRDALLLSVEKGLD